MERPVVDLGRAQWPFRPLRSTLPPAHPTGSRSVGRTFLPDGFANFDPRAVGGFARIALDSARTTVPREELDPSEVMASSATQPSLSTLEALRVANERYARAGDWQNVVRP